MKIKRRIARYLIHVQLVRIRWIRKWCCRVLNFVDMTSNEFNATEQLRTSALKAIAENFPKIPPKSPKWWPFPERTTTSEFEDVEQKIESEIHDGTTLKPPKCDHEAETGLAFLEDKIVRVRQDADLDGTPTSMTPLNAYDDFVRGLALHEYSTGIECFGEFMNLPLERKLERKYSLSRYQSWSMLKKLFKDGYAVEATIIGRLGCALFYPARPVEHEGLKIEKYDLKPGPFQIKDDSDNNVTQPLPG